MVELERYGTKYVSRGFHVYRDIWKPKLSQLLEVLHEQGNVHDPFATTFKVISVAMLTAAVIGHIPGEISCFCQYFMDYRGTVCRISPFLNKGLEIPVTLIMKKVSTNSEVFRKMKHFLDKYYIETELIKRPEVEEDDELSDDEISDEFVPVEDGEETNTVQVSEPNDDNETNTVVQADEQDDDNRINATVVDNGTTAT